MTTKKQIIDEIQDAVSNDQYFGDSIVDKNDAWRDAITKYLRKHKKSELLSLYQSARKINSQEANK